MTSAATLRRLRYLHDAASRLFVTAPTSAAVFEAEVSSIAETAGLTLQDTRGREICNACGNIMAAGLSCTVSIKSAGPRPPKPARQSKAGMSKDAQRKHKPVDKVMLYTCKRCSKTTRVSAGINHRTKRLNTSTVSKPKVANEPPDTDSVPDPSSRIGIPKTVESAPSIILPVPSVKPPGNSGSKQRAKARKQSGLQALLAKNKAGANMASGGGLDLMDFMKTG